VNQSDSATTGDEAHALVEELLRTAFSLGGAFVTLLEKLPEDALPGEDRAAALVDAMAGSVRLVIAPSRARDCQAAIALIGAIRERIFADLKVASGWPETTGGSPSEARRRGSK